MIVERIEFQTAAQLIAAIERIAPGVPLDEIYILDAECEELSVASLEQETLSDGSVVFNIILS